VGLARLRGAAIGYDSLDQLLDGMLRALTPDGCDDDTAILAVQMAHVEGAGDARGVSSGRTIRRARRSSSSWGRSTYRTPSRSV